MRPPARPGRSPPVGVPPHVERVDHDADLGAGIRRRQVQRLPERGDHRPVGGEHRVQRLEHHPHAVLDRERHQLGDPVGDPCRAATRSRSPSGSPPTDQDQLRVPSVGGLVDRAPVVVERARPASSAAVRNPPRHRLRRRSPASGTMRAACVRRPPAPGRATARCATKPALAARLAGLGQVSAYRRGVQRSRSYGSIVRPRTRSRRAGGPAGGRPAAGSSSSPGRRPGRTAADQVPQRPAGVQPAHQGEAGLEPVEPGQERDPGLVVVGGRGEDVPAQRLGRGQDRPPVRGPPASKACSAVDAAG